MQSLSREKEMRKSTGPRTARGKARASQNAAKHWVESKRILPGEQQEAAILRNGFTKDFSPEGAIENEVIEDLVFNRLIKRRVDIAFTREFSKASIETTIKELDRHERATAQYWLRIAGLENEYRTDRESAERLGPDDCISALEGLQRRIRERGVQLHDLAMLRAAYGDQPTERAAAAMFVLVSIAEKNIEQDKTAEAKNEAGLKEEFLETLQAEIERQEDREGLAERILDIERASDVQEPARPALETLLRYRAANTREFRDLLDSLERIRRLRRSAA
jgi:hypothetical protein